MTTKLHHQTRQITEHMNIVASLAADEVADGEDIGTEVVMQLMPGANGRPGPGFLLVITMPGVEIGRRGFSLSVFPGLDMDDETLTGEIQRMIRAGRETRSEALVTGESTVKDTSPGRSSGLIVPGR